MTRPSDKTRMIVDRVVVCLAPIVDAARYASRADLEALAYLADAVRLADAWSRNLTETDRRKAYGAAASAEALARSAALPFATPQGAAVRRAMAVYGAALQTLLNGDLPAALRAAEGAALSARARFANVSPMVRA